MLILTTHLRVGWLGDFSPNFVICHVHYGIAVSRREVHTYNSVYGFVAADHNYTPSVSGTLIATHCRVAGTVDD